MRKCQVNLCRGSASDIGCENLLKTFYVADCIERGFIESDWCSNSRLFNLSDSLLLRISSSLLHHESGGLVEVIFGRSLHLSESGRSSTLRDFAKFEKCAVIPRKLLILKPIFCSNVEFGAVHKYAHLVDLEKCCQTHI